MSLSDKILKDYDGEYIHINTERFLIVKAVKEFINEDWILTNHFLYDLFRAWDIDEEIIEELITKLFNKKKKLAGEDLIWIKNLMSLNWQTI